MTTTKLLRLVAPLLVGATTLFGAEASAMRSWTDLQGRSIQARLLAPPVEGVIKIERADGQVFNLNVARLSQADQDYLRSFTEPASAGPAETSGGSEGLRVLSPQDWELLAQLLSITPRTYADTPADEVVEMLNRRLAASEFRLPDGRPISIRLEGEATQARISADIRYAVNLATFLQDVTKSSRLELRLDAKQQLVLLASSAANQGKEPIKFLGL